MVEPLKSPLIPLAQPYLAEDEARAVYDTLKSGWITEGRRTSIFEKAIADYVGTTEAVAASSGTGALVCALVACGIRPGDEVVVPSMTCPPTVSAVIEVGAIPVFADVESETLNIDPNDVSARITKKTKAVIPINYSGHPADMERLMEICSENGVLLVEDAAQALGAVFGKKKVGSFGRAAIFSFTPNKTITTGEGGMVVTDDRRIAERVRRLKRYGFDQSRRLADIGFNFKMTDIQAAIGIEQMKKIEEIISMKRNNARYLTSLLTPIAGIRTPSERLNARSVFNLYTIAITSEFGLTRGELMSRLAKIGIQTRVYFSPVHQSRVYSKDRVSLPVTERLARSILSLPMSPIISKSSLRSVASSISRLGEG